LEKNSSDEEIFNKLKQIVQQCWETNSENRPKISAVKSCLATLRTQSKEIYDRTRDVEAVKFLYFEERNWKRKRTGKHLTF